MVYVYLGYDVVLIYLKGVFCFFCIRGIFLGMNVNYFYLEINLF